MRVILSYVPRGNQLARQWQLLQMIHDDRYPDLEADFILANPPFNTFDWRSERLHDDKRWQYGASPAANATLAWVQGIVYHGAASATSRARTTHRFAVI